MPHLCWQQLFLATTLTALGAGVAHARPAPVHWERIHVYHLAPTVVFAKLGLTHSVKNGHTRDGKHGIPDPTFPPGLTDVVPYDSAKLLIVRGTTGGLTLFRSRVAAADIPAQPLHLHAELTRRQGDGAVPFGTADQDEKGNSLPLQVSLGDGAAARIYQITTRPDPDGTFWVACRISLPLPPPPAADGPAPAVFVPIRVWTDPLSRKLRPGETAVFEDLASFRRAAGRKLGATGPDTADDYTLRVTLTPSTLTPSTLTPSTLTPSTAAPFMPPAH